MRECVRFEFESASDARGFVISVLQEMQDNQGVSVDAFNKRLESFDKRLAFIEGEIKAFKAREKEQEKEIASLQKRIWALEPSEADLKKREQKRIKTVEHFKNRVKCELKTELLEFIKGELAKETDGLKTTLAEYESGLKTPEVAEARAEAQKADETPEMKIERRRAYQREYYQKNKERLDAYTKNAARWRHPEYKAKRRAYERKPTIKYALELYGLNKERLLFGGITLYYFKRLLEIRKTQRYLYKKTAGADISWLLDLVDRYGKHAISFLKAAFDYHAQTGKQPERTFKIINFAKVGLFAEDKRSVND